MTNQIVQYVEHYQTTLAEYLPGGTDRDEWIRSLYLLFSERPELQRAIQTSKGAISLYNGLKVAAASGLSLNPKLGELSLIAYGDKIEIQTSKAGWIKLALQSGKVDYLDTDIVRENDTFSVSKTMDGDRFEHKLATTDRGNMIGVWAAMKDHRGNGHVSYMTCDEIDQHRDAYSKQSGPNSAWGKSYPGMALKTVIKKLLRTVQISDAVTATVRLEDQTECNPQPTNKGTGAGALGAILATSEVLNNDNENQERQTQPTDNQLLRGSDQAEKTGNDSDGKGSFNLESGEGDY